ncbi:MAG TPA: hypothetical protein VGK45_09530 [Thermoanaerobaculia bacterium]|jgi:hypothetical protein
MQLTGEVSVRFHGAPSDAELAGFAVAHGLRLLRRNELVPQQAVFVPLGSDLRSIPSVIQRIEREGAARAVWANTLSAPQRS